MSTFTYRTSEQAEVTIKHVSLDVGHKTALRPSTMDEACIVMLHLNAADRIEWQGFSSLPRNGRCIPGSVHIISRQEALTLHASHRLEALVVGIPHLSASLLASEATRTHRERRAEAHDSYDAVGHKLGLSFLAAFKSAADPPSLSTVHLARALCYHFAFRHAWAQGNAATAEQCGLAPWQARAAVRLLGQGELQVREVAAACRLSSSAFSRLFRSTFLRSPNEWKAERRIGAVKALLLDADVSIASAALRAGFSDQTSMSRSFRRLVGTSPAAWRAAQRADQT